VRTPLHDDAEPRRDRDGLSEGKAKVGKPNVDDNGQTAMRYQTAESGIAAFKDGEDCRPACRGQWGNPTSGKMLDARDGQLSKPASFSSGPLDDVGCIPRVRQFECDGYLIPPQPSSIFRHVIIPCSGSESQRR